VNASELGLLLTRASGIAKVSAHFAGGSAGLHLPQIDLKVDGFHA
jgi:hypothetical protein